jgi:cold shock protein
MAQLNGTIKTLLSDKGFGFIAADDGREYFFHQSACLDGGFSSLRQGQAVTFERGPDGPKGPRGENVRAA